MLLLHAVCWCSVSVLVFCECVVGVACTSYSVLLLVCWCSVCECVVVVACTSYSVSVFC